MINRTKNKNQMLSLLKDRLIPQFVLIFYCKIKLQGITTALNINLPLVF